MTIVILMGEPKVTCDVDDNNVEFYTVEIPISDCNHIRVEAETMIKFAKTYNIEVVNRILPLTYILLDKVQPITKDMTEAIQSLDISQSRDKEVCSLVEYLKQQIKYLLSFDSQPAIAVWEY